MASMIFRFLIKTAFALVSTLVFIGVLGFVSFMLFAPEVASKPGFIIAIQEPGSATAAAATAEPSMEELFATASVEKGATVAKKCAACHNFTEGGANKVGPNLYGVVQREVATVDGFAYSAAMKAKGGKWSPEALSEFLTNPKGVVPGTAMGFAGLPKGVDRANMIAYLNSLSHDPQSLVTTTQGAGSAQPAPGKLAGKQSTAPEAAPATEEPADKQSAAPEAEPAETPNSGGAE